MKVRVFRRISIVLVTLLTFSVWAEAKQENPALFNTKIITNFSVSPDESSVLIFSAQPEINSKDPEKSFWKESSEIFSLKDKELKNFSSALYMPQWSEDGNWITYLAPGKEKISLWVTSKGEFKPKKILELENDIYAYKFSPDGKKLIVTFVSRAAGESDDTRVVYSEQIQSFYIPQFYNVSEGFSLQKSSIPGFPKEFPMYAYFDKPNELFVWSPDSRYLAFLSQSQGHSSSQNTQISIGDVSSGKILTTIDKGGSYSELSFSPNGKWLAYRTDAFPGKTKVKVPIYEIGASRICLTSTETFEEKSLAKTFNEVPILIGWTKDNESVVVLEEYKTGAQFYKLGIDQQEAIPLLKTTNQVISFADINPKTSSLFYIAANFKKPSELYSLNLEKKDLSKSEVVQLSHMQPASLQKKYKTEIISWKSTDGKEIEGILLLPEEKKEKHPLLVILHDGPAKAWKQDYLEDFWSPYLDLPSLLKSGYAILAPNYRGSTGYGLDFRQSNYKDLGGGDYQDVMTGIDHVIKQGVVDPEKIAIWGWGYGGYLSSWAVTQTDRFKAAIVGAGITDWISFVGETTNPEIWEAYFGGYYWDNPDLYTSKSPSFHMKEVKTPTLIQWGYEDALFPWNQAFELDYSFSDNNVPHQLIWYLKERHELVNPYHIVKASKDLMEWLNKEVTASSQGKSK